MIDKDEYPQTAELEQRCVNILSHLWNAPAGSHGHRLSTTGSSEACMLGGMALPWRWRARRQAAGQDATRPNLVMGFNVQVCWEKFCRYWQVEPRFVPMVPGRLHLRGAEAAAKCDENTIGVVAIMGSTMDGSYEPCSRSARPWTGCRPNRATTCRSMWTARREGLSPRSCSPNWSGISGFRGWRPSTPRATSTAWYIPGSAGSCGGPDALPDDLVFRVNYLGGEMPTFALNFSRPGAQVAAQYYNFIRLGRQGYQRVQHACRDVALHLSAEIAKIGPLELLTEGRDLPVFEFKLRDDITGYSVFDVRSGCGCAAGRYPPTRSRPT